MSKNDFSFIFHKINKIHLDIKRNNLSDNDRYNIIKEFEEILEKYKNEYLETDNEIKLNFSNPIDFIIYITKNKFIKKDIKWIDFPVCQICNLLEYLYIDLEEYENAKKYIDIGFKYAPMQITLQYEKIEIYKILEDFDNFENQTRHIFDDLYTAKDIARYYRNLAYVYSIKKKYKETCALYLISLVFEENEYIYSLIAQNKFLAKIEDLPWPEVFDLLYKENIPIRPKNENIELIKKIFEDNDEFTNSEQLNLAFRNRLYELTQDSQYIKNPV